MLDVVEIVLEFFEIFFDGGDGREVFDLCPAGQPWAREMAQGIVGHSFRELSDEFRTFRSRPDEREVSAQNVPDLGKLIEP